MTENVQNARLAEFDAALLEWIAATTGNRTGTRGTLTADRDRPNTYVQIVERHRSPPSGVLSGREAR
jgi:hypothetical protein